MNMKLKKKRFLGVLSMVICLSLLGNIPAYAAGKTVEAFKNNTYEGTSDCKKFVNGIKQQVPSYKSTLKQKTGISLKSFKGKTKAIKYWASHGSSTGRLWGSASGVDFNIHDIANFKWSGKNLEFVFLAACYQLSGDKNRGKYANAMIGNKAVRVICGYHEKAPGAGTNKDGAVVDNFMSYAKTGESVKSSWILANKKYGNNNYLVLTHKGNVQYSRFEGFPGNTYSRPGAGSTTILRFSSAKPNGVTQPRNLSANLKLGGETDGIDIAIPNYAIKATDVDVSVKGDMDVTVLSDDGGTTTLNGEVKDQGVEITADEAEDKSAEWINQAFEGVNFTDFNNGNLELREIVAAEVDLDGNSQNEVEETVAYDVTYEYTFDGIPVKGDFYSAIVDAPGVVSSMVNHNEYEIIPSQRTVQLSLEDALKALENEVKGSGGLRISTFAAEDAVMPEALDVNVAFCDSDNDGIFEPSYIFDLTDGSSYQVNSMTGECLSND